MSYDRETSVPALLLTNSKPVPLVLADMRGQGATAAMASPFISVTINSGQRLWKRCSGR